VDTRLNQNQTELGVLVLAIALQMLADADGLLDQMVEVLGQTGRQALGLEHAQDLVARDEADLTNTMRISQNDTDLRWCQPLLGQFVDLLFDIVGRQFQPRWDRASVGQSRL